MKTNIQNYNIVTDEKDADTIVVNACTVTNGADSDVRAYINKVRKYVKNPKIIYTGCGSQTQGKTMLQNQTINKLFPANQKENINQILKTPQHHNTTQDFSHIDGTIIDDYQDKTKAFIKIQEGCDFSCGYCIIPQVRGNSRSYEVSFILKQIKTLTDKGFGEFVLTGTNIGSYGTKGKNSLASLLKDIYRIKGVKRVRFGSVEPSQITDEFKEMLDEPWIAKHLHIALQHTSETMLKIMQRRNNFKDDIKLFEFLSEKGFALGTDFIVGHPGETDTIWLEALSNFKLLPLTHIHSFRYSPRQNTKSAKLKLDVDGNTAKDRLNQIKDITTKNNYKFRQNKQELEVLIEQKKHDFFIGYDQYYNKLKIKSNTNLLKKWINTKQYETKEDYNLGLPLI
jgi:MiaB-like tRNA modifying enzyme